MNIRRGNTKFLALLFGVFTIAVSTFAFTSGVAHAAIDNTPDCDTVAIIKCGAFSESALKKAYDKDSYGDIKKVYDAFDISRSDLSGFKDGIVYRNGEVKVDGKVVATDAMTAGRNYGGTRIAGTENAGKYSVSKFVDEGQTAFVKMNSDGTFAFAIVKACGNPVNAKPKKETPKPMYACDELTKKKISRTEYEFTASGSADNGAKVTGYRFDFGDGKTTTTTSKTVSHTYSEEGDYDTTAQTRVSVEGSTKYADGKDCAQAITVAAQPTPEQTEVCNPDTGKTITVDKTDANKYKPVGDKACTDTEVCVLKTHETTTIKESEYDSAKHSRNLDDCKETEQPTTLPSTGPEQFVMGGLGLSSLTAAGYYAHASRRNLIRILLRK